MRHALLAAVLGYALLPAAPPLAAQSADAKPYDSLVAGLELRAGFFDYYVDPAKGRVLLSVPVGGPEFIYVNSLAAGVGSNDIGLDRGQLGDTRLVRFRDAGARLLLVQPNLGYRADSDDAAERASVAEAFAESVLWGFPVLARKGGGGDEEVALVDLTPMLLSDAHDVAGRLQARGQGGGYKLDADRSALYLERTRNFPRNSEFEATVTLSGKPEGSELRSVTPTPEHVTTRQHHSFVALPEPGYRPRAYDPRSGYYPVTYADYASPIGAPLERRYVPRHRLERVDPDAASSAAVEPLVYYLDPGTPEPVRSALLDGARWWDEAFQAAGFAPGTFRVELLPPGADPLDVRYNVIQWVHRSTRGWSYGASVRDPRTGEIIKGHVSLGSLRVRQDYLIAQGLLDAAYGLDGEPDPRLLAFALARLRQLSAHEVGHTLGLAHNFAASTRDRASVMDYPHPYVTLGEDGAVDLSQAYATGVGTWDKQAIAYGYRVFGAADADDAAERETEGLAAVLAETARLGLPYLTDRDARARGGVSADAHLWDNGADAAAELRRVSALRRHALSRLGLDNLAPGRPLAELEAVLVPVYLMHRYQVEAAVKVIAGMRYGYGVIAADVADAGAFELASEAEQRAALDAVLATLRPDFLAVPPHVTKWLAPLPPGSARDRELFAARTGLTFDPAAAAEASVEHTVSLLLDPARVERVVQVPEAGERLDGEDYRRALAGAARAGRPVVAARMLEHALALAADRAGSIEAQAWAWRLARQLSAEAPERGGVRELLQLRVRQFEAAPADFVPEPAARIPDGSPIGCGE